MGDKEREKCFFFFLFLFYLTRQWLFTRRCFVIVCRLCDSFFHLSLIRVDALSVLGTIFLQIVSAGDSIMYYISKVL